jgi:4-hydroxybenzoate polyprenyltransferase
MDLNLLPARERIATFLEMVKFSHTIFALPFALLAALLAANGLPSPGQLFWIIIAMAGARTGAMGANRLLDKEIDARNPRTRERALPAGRIETRQAFLLTLASYLVFIFAAYMLNPLCFHLAPYIIIILTGYSLAKRYTVYTHYILGFCLALAPIGAWIAVAGSLALTPVILGLAVACWVSGFDLLYSLQDIEFDRSEGLYSIPAAIGVEKTLALARRLHLGMLAGLFLVWLLSPGLGWLFFLALVIVAALLHYEHGLLSPDDLSNIDIAFFTINGWISLTLFIIAAIDIFAG